MLENTAPYKNQHVGNGSVVTFPFTFPVESSAQVRVIVTDSDEVDSLKSLGTDYSVTLTSSGGSVVFSAAPALGERVTLLRGNPADQNVDVPTASSLNTAEIEKALDALAMIAQKHEEQLSRTLMLPDGGVYHERQASLPSLIGNETRLLGLNAAGNQFEFSDGISLDITLDGDDFLVSALSSGDFLVWNGFAFTNMSLSEAGVAAAEHSHSADEITSGVLSPSRLGSGAASGTTFLRGDGVWATVSGGGGGGMSPAIYDEDAIAEQVVGLSAEQTMLNKTFTGATLFPYHGSEDVEYSVLPADNDNPQVGGIAISVRGVYSSTQGEDVQVPVSVVAQDLEASAGKVVAGRFAAAVGDLGTTVNGGSAMGFNAVGHASEGSSSSLIVAMQVDVTNNGADNNETHGLVIQGDGNRATKRQNRSALLIKTTPDATSDTGEFKDGIVFDFSIGRNVVEGALLKSSGEGSVQYGVHIDNLEMTAGIYLQDISATWGVAVNGNVTVGFQSGADGTACGFRASGSGTNGFEVQSGSYSNGFHCYAGTSSQAGFLDASAAVDSFKAAGSGNSAFTVASNSYQYGLNFGSSNFSNGYLIYHSSIFRVENSGNLRLANNTIGASSRSFSGKYLQVADMSGNAYYIPLST